MLEAMSLEPYHLFMTTADIFSAAMELPTELRAELALQLVDSLPAQDRDLGVSDWQSAWTDEVNARLAAIDSGRMKTVSADEVHRVARERIRALREG